MDFSLKPSGEHFKRLYQLHHVAVLLIPQGVVNCSITRACEIENQHIPSQSLSVEARAKFHGVKCQRPFLVGISRASRCSATVLDRAYVATARSLDVIATSAHTSHIQHLQAHSTDGMPLSNINSQTLHFKSASLFYLGLGLLYMVAL